MDNLEEIIDPMDELIRREEAEGITQSDVPEVQKNNKPPKQESQDIATNKSETPNSLDGWVRINKAIIPYEGSLYPDSWQFAYRSPDVKEVARFSAINESDPQAALKIFQSMDDLIKKCIKIYDTYNEVEINTGNINKSDKIFFFLFLRDAYLPGQPIKYESICTSCDQSYNVSFKSDMLMFPEIDEKILSIFDGRCFSFKLKDTGEVIKVHMPTISLYDKIVQPAKKVRKDQMESGQSKNTNSRIINDTVFQDISLYLYEDGTESFNDIINKFKKVYNNPTLLEIYRSLGDILKFDNLATLESTCEHCGSLEVSQLQFPGGIRKIFSKDIMGKFDI